MDQKRDAMSAWHKILIPKKGLALNRKGGMLRTILVANFGGVCSQRWECKGARLLLSGVSMNSQVSAGMNEMSYWGLSN